jgi:hypothetical protein
VACDTLSQATKGGGRDLSERSQGKAAQNWFVLNWPLLPGPLLNGTLSESDSVITLPAHLYLAAIGAAVASAESGAVARKSEFRTSGLLRSLTPH